MDITIKGMDGLLGAFDKLPQQMKEAVKRGLRHAAQKIHRDATRNAPRSPSSAQIKKNRKTNRKTHTKASAFSRAKPGGLERSIAYNVFDDSAEVFVAENAECVSQSKTGRYNYAARIHDQKGITWKNRGIGTIAKGLRADDKFIERAMHSNADFARRKIESEFKKLTL